MVDHASPHRGYPGSIPRGRMLNPPLFYLLHDSLAGWPHLSSSHSPMFSFSFYSQWFFHFWKDAISISGKSFSGRFQIWKVPFLSITILGRFYLCAFVMIFLQQPQHIIYVFGVEKSHQSSGGISFCIWASSWTCHFTSCCCFVFYVFVHANMLCGCFAHG